jgi:hypothetical protein
MMGKTNTNQVPKVNGIQVNQSQYDTVITYLYGRGKIAPKLIWQNDFQTHSGSSKKGKGGSKKGKGGGQDTYTIACDFLLATAPLRDVLSVWSNKDKYIVNTVTLTIPVTAGIDGYAAIIDLDNKIPLSKIASSENHPVPGSGPYTVAVVHAVDFLEDQGVIYHSSKVKFTRIATGSVPTLGQYAVDPATGIYTFAAADHGVSVDITYTYSSGLVPYPSQQVVISVLGVAVDVDVNVAFDDYYDPAGGTVVNSTQPRNLWNADYTVPEAWEEYYGITSRAPYTYSGMRVLSNNHLVVPVDASLLGSTATIRVAYAYQGTNPLLNKVGSKVGLPQAPLNALNIYYEQNLGNGPEYVKYPGQQIIYPDCSGVASPKADLGGSASYPNMSFECTGMFASSLQGDCNPADIAYGIVLGGIYKNYSTPPLHFANNLQMLCASVKAINILGDTIPVMAPLDDMRNYCEAYGIYGTLEMDSQSAATDWMDQIIMAANCAPIQSGFQIKLVPYCEVSTAGNGYAYTAPTASGPVVRFTESSFLGKEPSITVSIKQKTDQANVVPIEYLDRNNEYAVSTTPGINQGSVYQSNAIRPVGTERDPSNTKQLHFVHESSVAHKVTSVMTKRGSIQLNEYRFKVSAFRYTYLDPMDLATIPGKLVNSLQTEVPIRLTEVSDDGHGTLDCTAEDFYYGMNCPQPATGQQVSPTIISSNVDPGPVNDPIIFLAVDRMNQGASGKYLVFGLSGLGAYWGGAVIYASSDGTSYSRVGNLTGKTVMGLTTATFGITPDPDTTVNLLVDLSESRGELTEYSLTDQNNFVPLCYIEGGSGPVDYELVSIGNSILTGPNAYTIEATGGGNQIRRGTYGTPIVSHPSGSKFALLSNIAEVLVDPTWVGKTVYFKFPSFNIFGGQQQDLADCVAYPFTIPDYLSPSSNNYTNNPAASLLQPQGVYEIDMLPVDVTFTNPAVTVHYNARTFTVPDPGAGLTQVYYITIADPAYAGDVGSSPTLTAYCETTPAKAGVTGYTYMGSIYVSHVGGGLVITTIGGWPAGQAFLINGQGPSTAPTLAEEFGHNTAAFSPYNQANFPSLFTGTTWTDTSGTTLAVDSALADDSFNPVTPAHRSFADVHLLIPAAPTIPIYAHVTPWFGHSGHVNGTKCNTIEYVKALYADLVAAGFNGISIDWYGPGSFEDQFTQLWKTYCASVPGNTMKYLICADKGMKSATGGALTQAVLQANINYIDTNYWSDANYALLSGSPILQFFGVREYLKSTQFGGSDAAVDAAMSAVKGATTAAYWQFFEESLIAKSYCDGCFMWTSNRSTGISGTDPFNLVRIAAIDTAFAAHPTKPCSLSFVPGFDGYTTGSVSWSKGKYLPRIYPAHGSCWMSRAAQANSLYRSQYAFVMVPTWNDYQEGSQIETAIDTEQTIPASIAVSTLTWSASGGTGDESMIYQYKVLASADGVHISNSFVVATGVGTFNLAGAGLTSGIHYTIYVEAIGQPCVRNKVSAPMTYVA